MSKVFILAAILASFWGREAQAISTAASFDLSYGIMDLGIDAFDRNGTLLAPRTLSSRSVFQIDYNVALFDYKTVATISFMKALDSNLGKAPFTRFAIGASYHFIRVNGQRVVLDNQVEAKSWGISPAVEVTVGMSLLAIKDPDPSKQDYDFTASKLDVIPRLLLEIPASSSFLIMFRAGFATSLVGSGLFPIKYSGSVFNLGFKLTTL